MSGVHWIKVLALAMALQVGTATALVPGVRERIAKNDFAAAETLTRDYRRARGATPEFIEAVSWLARGAFAQKRYDQAERYAAETYQMCLDALKTRPVDAEPHLPIALGAAIEVRAQLLAERNRRSEAVALLRRELSTWRATSIRTRIQKNLNLLSLVGTAAPELESREWLGPKPPNLSALKGKVVLMFFWAHWCPDCKIEGPVLARLRQEYGSRGLVLLAPTQRYGYVAEGRDAPPDQEKAYIETVRRRYYAPLLDVPAPVSEENFKAYGASTTPTLVLLDRNGIVRLYNPGTMPYPALAAQIEAAL